jgi:aconitate hydratase
VYDIEPIRAAGQQLRVKARGEKELEFVVKARIDSPIELDYYRNGGILQTVLRRLAD